MNKCYFKNKINIKKNKKILLSKNVISLFGVDLPEKFALYALQKIKGIGLAIAKKILNHFKIDYFAKLYEIDKKFITDIKNYIDENIFIGNEVISMTKSNINNLIKNNSYRGMRHLLGLPIKGSKANGKTAKKLNPKRIKN